MNLRNAIGHAHCQHIHKLVFLLMDLGPGPLHVSVANHLRTTVDRHLFLAKKKIFLWHLLVKSRQYQDQNSKVLFSDLEENSRDILGALFQEMLPQRSKAQRMTQWEIHRCRWLSTEKAFCLINTFAHLFCWYFSFHKWERQSYNEVRFYISLQEHFSNHKK